MSFIIIKVLVSAVFIVIITEVAKRSILLGGMLAAMPLTTVLAMFWLYYENKDLNMLSEFLVSVLWGVMVSFLFFVPAIYMFKKGFNFYLTVFVSVMVLGVGAYLYQRFSPTQ